MAGRNDQEAGNGGGQKAASAPVQRPALPLAPIDGYTSQMREEFCSLAACLLAEGGDPDDFLQAALDLYGLFNDISGRPQDIVGPEAITWQQETPLAEGIAINPFSAAICVLDDMRTRAFAGGVCDAIKASQEQYPGECIEVLYAGAGPFAPLALLQTPFFSSDEVQFTLIDIHPAALACQAQIISVLGLEPYIEATIQADATQWHPPGGEKYHVVVAEVMQRGLITEPQVGVTEAIARHLRSGGFLVPERIDLSLCLLSPEAEQERAVQARDRLGEYFDLSGDSIPDVTPILGDSAAPNRIFIDRVFSLTKSVAEDYERSETGIIPLQEIHLPDPLPAGLSLRVLTEIRTFGDFVLGDYASGLTFPEALDDSPSLTPGGTYTLNYESLGVPGLRLTRAEGPSPS